jgi:hypothetical protein
LSGSTFTWTGATANNDWNTAANWNIGAATAAVPPNDPTATVIDSPTETEITIISGGTADTVGTLTVGGAAHLIVGGGPKIGGGGGGSLTAINGIDAPSTDPGGAIVGGPNSTITSPTLTIGPGAIIGGGGDFEITNLVNNGMIQADGADFDLGALTVGGGNITGTGSIEIDGPSTFKLGSATAQNVKVAIAPTDTASLILDNPTTFTGAIDLANADTHLNLFLKGETPTSATYDQANHLLTITGASGTLKTIPLTSNGTVFFAATPSTLAGYGEISISPTPTPTPTPTPGLAVFDGTTGATIPAVADTYTGPVAGLQEQYINITPDSLNISTSTPNWFIHSGSGVDAIAVSSGTNVIDGGTNSNFLTGGTGTDTFFVDDRGPAADIWSTVSNFGAGDSATVWGVTPGDFNVAWVDGQGATGATGLTMHATATGKPTASLTLVGYSSADLSDGRLAVSFGTDAGSGSSFMYVHAA